MAKRPKVGDLVRHRKGGTLGIVQRPSMSKEHFGKNHVAVRWTDASLGTHVVDTHVPEELEIIGTVKEKD